MQPAKAIDYAIFKKFNDWTLEYRNADEAERAQMVATGMALATQRRGALAALIPGNPREAIAQAVPMVVRQDLPAEVTAQLEERVNDRAFFGVLGVVGGDAATPIHRRVETSEGQSYEAYVYGRRERQRTTETAYIEGIAVDRKLALDERPLRVLESGERIVNGKKIVQNCPVSGKKTELAPVNEELPPVNSETPAVEIGGTVHYLCSGGHIAAVEDDLVKQEGAIAAEGSTGGAAKPTGTVPGGYNTGVKSHLYIRVTFPDQMQDPQSESSCYDMMRQVDDFIRENSYGKCYFITTVTPLLVLPRTEAWYKVNDNDGAVLTDARTIAKAAGYDPAQYDFDTVRYNGGPGSFGGQAYVGGKGCWLKSSGAGVACHEYGHNLGLWHANFWNTSPKTVIGPGTNNEYGNSFDTMGNAAAGNNHYGAYNKSVINWMTSELVTTVRQSGTYRIFQHDQPIADPARRYGLKIAKDNDRNYWCEFRQKFTSNMWMSNGLHITWDAWGAGGDASANGSNGGPQLLDMTPGSPDDKNDSALVIGRTFSDMESGVHITPVGKGGTSPESIDVVVNVGDFPGNQAPTLSLTASATTVATSANVTFTATASDPDGDTLAYAWDFGDKSFSTTNVGTVTKSWSAAGQYNVRCTVSDMKGQVATRYVVVTVGSVSTFMIAGNIVDPAGQPLEGVLVTNGLTSTSFRGAYTDSSGNYTITSLATGSYTLAASKYGYNFTAGFSNPVAVGPNATAKNFTSSLVNSLTITAVDATANELGDTARFRITRTGSTAAAQVIRFLSPSGTATRTSDYTLSPDLTVNSTTGVNELSIPAGSATLDITVTPVNDTTQEGPETVILQLIPMTGFVLTGTQQAVVTLDDNDTTLPRVKITATEEFAVEGADPAQFTISRTGATTTALTVPLTMTGTATNGSDYTSISSATIPVGASSVTVAVSPIDDALAEGNETVIATIASNAAYVRDSTAQTATVTINDNDLNVLTITASDATANENGDSGTFTISRTGDLSNALAVDYVVGGSALHGTDYLRLTGAATIPAGQSFTTISVIPIDDSIGEPSQTIVVQLRSKSTYLVGSPSSATVTLNDNDLPALSVVPYDGTALEPTSGTGTDTARFRIYRAGGTAAFTAYFTIGGTATPGTDYSAVAGSVSFAAGDTSKDITITPLADADFEDMETVSLTLTPNAAYTVEPENTATVQVIDADQISVSVSVDGSSITESSTSMRFYVSRSGSTAAALTVNYTMTGTATSGVDYTGATGSVTIPAGAAGEFVTLTPVNDTLAEGTESVTLQATPIPGTYGLDVGSATYLLGDNDATGLPSVRFNASSGSGSESSTTVTIPVTLSAASAGPVTVYYNINGGSATNGGVDYVFPNGGLTFPAGVTSQNLTLNVVDDNRPESNETVVITLSSPNAAVLGTATYTYTINDNDAPTAPTVAFAAATSTVQEITPAPQTIVVFLSSAATSQVTVDYAITGGTATSGADYTLNAGTLSFAAGETSKFVPISILSDGVAETNETVIVALSNPLGATLGSITQHTVTIEDNSSTFTVAVSDSIVGEPTEKGSFTITRTGSTSSAVAVNIAMSGTASNGIDYQAIPPTVNFAAGQSSAVISVTPINDDLIEGTETATLTINPGSSYLLGATAVATMTLTDEDKNAAPSFTKGANLTVNEDSGAQSVAWATAINPGTTEESTQIVTFLVSNDNPALFTVAPAIASNGTLTYTSAANANGSATVTVQARDNGGTVNGGNDTSAAQTFTISILAVNDAPSFTKGADQSLQEDSAPVTVTNWATNMVKGPANETAQTLQFLVTSNNSALFSQQPNVAPNGTLSFALAPNANGTATVSVRIKDDGGIANGGVDTSAPSTFLVTVSPVNDPPALAAIADITLPESTPSLAVDATGISAGAANEPDTVTLTAVSDNADLLPNPTVTYSSPAASGQLTLQPVAKKSGVANVTVTVSDGQGSTSFATRVFQVSVTSVNDAPTFAAGADQKVDEDATAQSVAWATDIFAGASDETSQKLDFIVTTDAPELFSSAPTITPSGVLTFTPAPDANGIATVSVKLHDDGGTANGGKDTSEAQTFTVTVNAVNDAPSFTKGPDVEAKQNASTQSFPGWASAISTGPSNESAQTASFTVTAANPALFTVQPEISSDGTLTFRPAPNANGSTTVTVRLQDSGGTANGGVDSSVEQTFLISTKPVNDKPAFFAGADQSVAQDAGPQTVTNWASGIIAGPEDEADQTVQFTVTSDKPNLFATSPALSPDGTLTYTPATNASGKAIVTVVARDSGGTADGGIDASDSQSFTITITTYDEETGSYNGLVRGSDAAAATNEKYGLAHITVRKKGAFSGLLQVAGRKHPFKGSFDKAGKANFAKGGSQLTLKRKGLPDLSLMLQLDVGNDTDKITGTLTEMGSDFATVELDRALYTSKKNPVAPYRNVPAQLQGKYTVIIADNENTATTQSTPAGDGVATLTVSSRGVAKIVGTLSDGTRFSCSNALSKANEWPLNAALFKGKGVLNGRATFRDNPGISDIDAAEVMWIKPAGSGSLYPAGWPNGAPVALVGAKFTPSTAHSAVGELPPEDLDGNASLLLRGGNLIDDAMTVGLNISVANSVKLVGPVNGLAIKINPANGTLTGSFIHPNTLKKTTLNGVVFQKQLMAAGFFLGNTQSGGFEISPAEPSSAE